MFEFQVGEVCQHVNLYWCLQYTAEVRQLAVVCPAYREEKEQLLPTAEWVQQNILQSVAAYLPCQRISIRVVVSCDILNLSHVQAVGMPCNAIG